MLPMIHYYVRIAALVSHVYYISSSSISQQKSAQPELRTEKRPTPLVVTQGLRILTCRGKAPEEAFLPNVKMPQTSQFMIAHNTPCVTATL